MFQISLTVIWNMPLSSGLIGNDSPGQRPKVDQHQIFPIDFKGKRRIPLYWQVGRIALHMKRDDLCLVQLTLTFRSKQIFLIVWYSSFPWINKQRINFLRHKMHSMV